MTVEDLDGWLSRFVQTSLAEDAVDRFVTMVDEEIVRTLPELAADPVLVDDLHRSTRHQWLAFLTALRQPEHELVLPMQAADLARSLARRGLEVRVLLRVYLNAHHGVFAYLNHALDELRDGQPIPDDVLRTVWSRADLWMDESIESLIETYYEERRRELDGSALRRSELVDALIAGKDVDPEHVMQTLGHPIQSWNTAFLVWTDQIDDRTRILLQSAAEDVARSLPGGTLLAQIVGSRDLRCWIATPRRPSRTDLERLEAPGPDGISIAVGIPGRGTSGFRSSHLEARAAQQLAMTSPLNPRSVHYDRVELLCLALADPDPLARMVRREVGPLLQADKNLAHVRETVLTFLANRMNVEATAEKLFIHGNTVRYRLTKAEELLGCPLAERPRHIELALQYVAYLGPPPG